MTGEETPFVWEGTTLATYGDIMGAVEAIVEADDAERAARFMEAYREVSEYADANVGYLCGYLDHDEMVAALRIFRTAHPILGDADEAGSVTPERAFQLGQEWGEAMKNS